MSGDASDVDTRTCQGRDAVSAGDGGPAYPRIDGIEPASWGDGAYHVEVTGGLTVRDYFAGQALAGITASYTAHHLANPEDGWSVKVAAIEAYAVADAMLRAREDT